MAWLKQNALALVLAAVTVVSTYAVMNYRLSTVEARQDRQGAAITDLQANNTQILVALGKLQTDIQYIRLAIDKLAK